MNDEGMPGELNDEHDLNLAPEGSGPVELVNKGPLPNTQWKKSSRTVEESLAEGISNEDVWMLIRRFDKVRGSRRQKNYRQRNHG